VVRAGITAHIESTSEASYQRSVPVLQCSNAMMQVDVRITGTAKVFESQLSNTGHDIDR
jgi:hypothetical protein